MADVTRSTPTLRRRKPKRVRRAVGARPIGRITRVVLDVDKAFGPERCDRIAVERVVEVAPDQDERRHRGHRIARDLVRPKRLESPPGLRRSSSRLFDERFDLR